MKSPWTSDQDNLVKLFSTLNAVQMQLRVGYQRERVPRACEGTTRPLGHDARRDVTCRTWGTLAEMQKTISVGFNHMVPVL